MHSKGGDGFLQVMFKILQLCVVCVLAVVVLKMCVF